MNLHELGLLAPVLAISIGILILMLQAAWRRSANISQGICVLTLIVSLGLLVSRFPEQVQTITLLFEYEPVGGFFSVLVLLISLSVALLQGSYMKNSVTYIEVSEEYYLLLLLSCLVAMLLTMASHGASLILGLELMGLSLLGMLAYQRQRAIALEAAIKYLLLSGAASSLVLLGLAFLYAYSGSLQLSEIMQSPSANSMSLLAKSGFVLIVAGLAFKLSLVPLHFWTPDVYQGAPVNSTLFLTSVSKTAVFAIFIKLILLIPSEFEADLIRMLSWMAIASMLLGNWLALQQQSVKRLMAYSAIAHMGYILVAGIIAIDIDHSLVLEGASYYLLAYLVASILIFAVLTLLSRFEEQQDLDTLEELKGLYWQHPWLAIIFALAFLSLAGMPITIGFIGKFYLLTLAVNLSAWWLVSAMVIGSAVGLYYYLRVIFALFAPLEKPTATVKPALFSHIWLSVVAASLLVLGLLPGLLGDELKALLGIG